MGIVAPVAFQASVEGSGGGWELYYRLPGGHPEFGEERTFWKERRMEIVHGGHLYVYIALPEKANRRWVCLYMCVGLSDAAPSPQQTGLEESSILFCDGTPHPNTIHPYAGNAV